MKNSKGFTLIELLAVIVILAIIALIATPIILNVIDTARKGSKESSTLGYIDAVEKQVMMAQVDSSAQRIPAGTYTVEQLRDLGVQVKGENPEGTSVLTINNKGAVSEAWITYQGTNYKIYYDGSRAVASTTEDYVDEKGNKHNTIATPGESSNNNNSSSGNGNSLTLDNPCPGCVYAYHQTEIENDVPVNPWYYIGENQTTLTSDQYKSNYNDVINETGKNYFLGLKLNHSNAVEEAYACGILNAGETNEKLFCIKGSTNNSLNDEKINYLKNNSLYGTNGCHNNNHCYGTISAFVNSDGSVGVYIGQDGCRVDYNGMISCS